MLFLERGDIYLAIRSLTEAVPVVGAGKIALPVPTSGDGFVIEVGSKGKQGSFAAFQAAIRKRTRLDRTRWAADGRVTYTDLHGDAITVGYARAAPTPLTEPTFD